MYYFGKKSKLLLKSLDPRLVEVLDIVIKLVDFTVLETHRGKEEQDKAVANGLSKLAFPKSKHNSLPSLAVDLAPYPVVWKDPERFAHLAGVIRGVALSRGLRVRWGGDWDRDGELSDNRFNDLPHFEIEEKK